MKFLFHVAIVSVALLPAQNPPASIAAPKPPIDDTTVVAVSAGTKITVADVNKLLENLPPQMRSNYVRDPKGFLNQWFMLKRLVGAAEQMKLQDRSPYKEGIDLARMQVLWQAMIEETSKGMSVSVEEQKKFYEQKKDNYTQAHLKVIYIPFSTTPQAAADGKKLLSEPEALAKAKDLVAQARGGGDFVKMVAEHSEDPISKAKQGDFGPIKRGDSLPEPVKQAVFSLKLGQISEPVQQPNGYYVFRLQELTPQAFDEVKDALQAELKNQRMREWMEANSKAVELKVERADFFEQAK